VDRYCNHKAKSTFPPQLAGSAIQLTTEFKDQTGASTAQDQLDSSFREYQKTQPDTWIGLKVQELTNLNEALPPAPLYKKLKPVVDAYLRWAEATCHGEQWRRERGGSSQTLSGVIACSELVTLAWQQDQGCPQVPRPPVRSPNLKPARKTRANTIKVPRGQRNARKFKT
jgi:hypothetical protein